MSALSGRLFDGPGGALLEALLAATWKGGLVVLLVLAVRALLGRRLPPRWRYGLWLLVAVRLLMPAGPPSPLSLFRLAGDGSGAPLPGLGDLPARAGAAAAAVPAADAGGPGLAVLLLAAWALGAAAAVAAGVRSRRRLGALLAGTAPVTEPAAVEMLERCRRTIGVRRRVRLLETAALAAPAIWPGAPWPGRGAAILLPAGRRREWTAAELRYVLLHELAHLRQGDGTAARLAGLLTALHWFNPLVHLAARRARADREPACDALVLSRLGAAERGGYGRALIRAAERARTQLPLPGLVGMADHGHQLRRRISMIAHDRPVSPRRAAALGGLALLLAIVSWTDGGALASPPPQEGAAAAAGPSDNEKQAVSIQRTREVGVAMFSWLTDVIAEGIDQSAAEAAAAEETPEPTTADWSACPPISYDELAKVLVPTYLEELPKTDGWDHPLEFCLNHQRPGDPRYIVGIRSPGRDGRFEGDVYPVGRFDPDALDRDVVWIDGYFITWPQKAE